MVLVPTDPIVGVWLMCNAGASPSGPDQRYRGTLPGTLGRCTSSNLLAPPETGRKRSYRRPVPLPPSTRRNADQDKVPRTVTHPRNPGVKLGLHSSTSTTTTT